MAYEKYIKKDGKIYGPYIYHSRRIEGKVVSEYHGQKKLEYGKFLWIIPVALLIILGAYLIGQQGSKITGHSVLDLNANYQEGQALGGKLKVSLQQGELIPASSVIVFENTGKRYEYPLKDLILEPSTEGDFFVNGKNISGSGEGFGISGTRDVYPDVYFILLISSKIEEIGDNITESEREVQGTVSSGNTFTYHLQEGERAEIKLRSVRTSNAGGTLQLSENSVSLTTEEGIVSVSTNYSEKEEGFGADFTGEKIKELTVNLNELNLLPEKGALKVGIYYEEEEIFSLETTIGENEAPAQETTPEEQSTTEQVISDSADNIIIPVTELTAEERAILLEEFGDLAVKQEAKSINNLIVVRYEIGGHWIEHSYLSNLDNETLNAFMKTDRTLWLKDIAKRFSQEEIPEKVFEVPEVVID